MLEYLILNGKFEAAKNLDKTDPKPISEKLMGYFHQGNREQFINTFRFLKRQSKLQFYLRVYFLIYSIHPALKAKNSIPQQQKMAFKDYLDNQGAQLAKTNEFLEFYALPFIKKPLENEAFKNLFKKEWVKHLKEKLVVFISEEEKRMKIEASKLFSNAEVTYENKDSTDKIKQMEKINKKLFEEVKQFTEKYHILEESNKSLIDGFNAHMLESQSKWFQITKQLVNCSKNLIHMLAASESAFLTDRKFLKIKKRIQKYEKFVNKRFDDLISQSQDISIFDKPSINQLSYSMAPHSQKNFASLIGVDEYLPTNFSVMKAHFRRALNHQKISILNGLYWRIIRSKDQQVRRMNIIGMFKQDFFGLHSGDLEQLLASRQLMKPTLRLLQIVSLDNYGRRILFVNNSLHRDFVSLIHQCEDQSSLEYLMYTLGQISSSKRFKFDLIKLDIIEICVQMLRCGEWIKNEIILENNAAILLNMLEKEEAFAKFERENDIFDVLKKYTQVSFKITRALVYGIIYALLENEELFYRAHDQKLDEFLAHILSTDPSINKKQLTILRQKLHNFQPKEPSHEPDANSDDENDSNDEEDEFDIDEEEVPELEEMMRSHQDIISKFGLKGNEARKQTKEVKEVLEQYKNNRVPHFFQPRKDELPKISSPKNVGLYRHPEQTPYIRQAVLNVDERPISKKKDNFTSDQKKQQNSFRVKEKDKHERQRPMTRQRDQRENNTHRIRQSKSAEKGINLSKEKDNRQAYESSRLPVSGYQKVTEFKSDDKNYRSPQPKKAREDILKQINDQIRAQEKIIKEKKKHSTAIEPRQNQLNSFLKSPIGEEIEGQAFQSKPKLRRTPPRD